MAKSAVKPIFSLDPLPVISLPKPPFFVRFGRFWVENHLFRGIYFFSSLDFLARNLILRRNNQFDGEFLFGVRPKFDFCRREKRGKQAFFLLTSDGTISKRRRFCQNSSTRTKSKRTSWKNKKRRTKRKGHHRKDQAQASKRNCFSLPPPLHSKNTSRLSLKTSPLFATSSLVSLKTSPPRTKSLSSYAQDTRLRVYTRPRSQRICLFCLHPSPHPTTNCISTG